MAVAGLRLPFDLEQQVGAATLVAGQALPRQTRAAFLTKSYRVFEVIKVGEASGDKFGDRRHRGQPLSSLASVLPDQPTAPLVLAGQGIRNDAQIEGTASLLGGGRGGPRHFQ